MTLANFLRHLLSCRESCACVWITSCHIDPPFSILAISSPSLDRQPGSSERGNHPYSIQAFPGQGKCRATGTTPGRCGKRWQPCSRPQAYLTAPAMPDRNRRRHEVCGAAAGQPPPVQHARVPGDRAVRMARRRVHARAPARTSGIGLGDYLIAATADVKGLVLATLSVRHFPMIKDLQAPFRV